MRERTKRAGGRGYQRAEWTNFHTRLVNIPDEVGGRTRREKVVKLTELLRNMEINSDQVQGTDVQSIDSEASQGGEDIDTVVGDINTNEERMEIRGEQMTEVKETLLTPLKVEFNINHTTGEFNIILAVKNLFTLMAEIDSSMRVNNNEHTVQLWEVNGHLCEEDDFVPFFKMREQTFRNGNKKVTVYFTVESTYTINNIKFRDPVKSFLLNNNIWVRPDFYSTKTVSSPGFFTMIHPRITNKQKYGELLRRELSRLDIKEDEEIVQEWIQEVAGNQCIFLYLFQFHSFRQKIY